MSQSVFFIRGYNSYATDDLRFGPLNFGPAHKHLEPAFRRAGFQFYALKNMGKGSYAEQVLSANQQIAEILGPHQTHHFHLLGHSAGGLVARLLAQQSPQHHQHVLSVVTITTPHHGARLAEHALQLQNKKPLLYRSLRALGYDMQKRRHLLEPLQPQYLKQFNAQVANQNHIRYGSVISGLHYHQLPLGMQWLVRQAQLHDTPTDGLVELPSQKWGTVIDELTLDHGAILGHSMRLLPQQKTKEYAQFLDMTQKVTQFMKSASHDRV